MPIKSYRSSLRLTGELMQEALLFGGGDVQDPTKSVKLLSTKLLYLVEESDAAALLSTRLLYLAEEPDPVKLLSVRLLYLVPEA